MVYTDTPETNGPRPRLHLTPTNPNLGAEHLGELASREVHISSQATCERKASTAPATASALRSRPTRTLKELGSFTAEPSSGLEIVEVAVDLSEVEPVSGRSRGGL